MTTHSKLMLANGDVLGFRSNPGATPKYLLNDKPITREQYEQLLNKDPA